jgi:hypothetical protein
MPVIASSRPARLAGAENRYFSGAAQYAGAPPACKGAQAKTAWTARLRVYDKRRSCYIGGLLPLAEPLPLADPLPLAEPLTLADGCTWTLPATARAPSPAPCALPLAAPEAFAALDCA